MLTRFKRVFGSLCAFPISNFCNLTLLQGLSLARIAMVHSANLKVLSGLEVRVDVRAGAVMPRLCTVDRAIAASRLRGLL